MCIRDRHEVEGGSDTGGRTLRLPVNGNKREGERRVVRCNDGMSRVVSRRHVEAVVSDRSPLRVEAKQRIHAVWWPLHDGHVVPSNR